MAQKKNGTAYFPQLCGCNNWYQCIVYEVTSPEKNYTKISNMGSVDCFPAHILWDNVETNFPLFSLN